ncbi:MAG: 30S ribosomal protein S18 [Planctomycetota bacterium]|nr:30S ribosomal protein S18 [Planctomycetota bacterium]
MASNTKIKNIRKLLKKRGERSKCRFTRARVYSIDWKDVPTLQKMASQQGKMYGSKRTGTRSHFQRKLKQAVKRARFMALLPYVGR